jgi:hypothetical protein
MFGHRVDEFAPVLAELNDFARDNFLRCRGGCEA